MPGLTAPGGDPGPEGSGSALPGCRGNSEPLIQLSVQRQAAHALPVPNTAGHGRLRKSVSPEHEGLSVGPGVPCAACLPPASPSNSASRFPFVLRPWARPQLVTFLLPYRKHNLLTTEDRILKGPQDFHTWGTCLECFPPWSAGTTSERLTRQTGPCECDSGCWVGHCGVTPKGEPLGGPSPAT